MKNKEYKKEIISGYHISKFFRKNKYISFK